MSLQIHSSTSLQQYLNEYLNSITNFDDNIREQSFNVNNQLINAIIVRVDSKHVIIDAKSKTQGSIPRAEFSSSDIIEVGQVIQVYRTVSNDGNRTHFSRRHARVEAIWSQLEAIYYTQNTIQGVITEALENGYRVEILDAPVMLPSKQLEAIVKNKNSIIGHRIQVKIIKLDRSKGIVTVSQKYAEHSTDALLATVIAVEPEKAILKANNQEYILLAEDYMWDEVPNLCSRLKVDQTIKVKFIEELNDIKYVSYKMLFSSPLQELVQQTEIEQGMTLIGTIYKHSINETIVQLDTIPIVEAYIPLNTLEIGSQHTVVINKIDYRHGKIIANLTSSIA